MCNYQQTSLDLYFTFKRIYSLQLEKGRITINGNTLKITSQENHTEKYNENEIEFNKYLKKYFNITIK